METSETKEPLLICERDSAAASGLRFACEQYRVPYFAISSPEELRKLLSQSPSAYVALGSGFLDQSCSGLTRIIYLIERGEEADLNLPYFPLPRVLYKPLATHEVSYILQSIYYPDSPELESFPVSAIAFKLALLAQETWLRSHLNDSRLASSFSQAAQEYCGLKCPRARLMSQVPEEEKRLYGFIGKSGRGDRRACSNINKCELLRFSGTLEQESTRFVIDQNPDDSSAAAFIAQIDASVSAISRRRLKFCLEECGLPEQGLGFSNGDIFLSSWGDLLKNNCTYCREHDCALASFLRVFTTHVVSR